MFFFFALKYYEYSVFERFMNNYFVILFANLFLVSLIMIILTQIALFGIRNDNINAKILVSVNNTKTNFNPNISAVKPPIIGIKPVRAACAVNNILIALPEV